MTFADLLSGDSVFLDANTLVYHFSAHAAFGAERWSGGRGDAKQRPNEAGQQRRRFRPRAGPHAVRADLIHSPAQTGFRQPLGDRPPGVAGVHPGFRE
jgi:hypothetical protein